LDRNHGCIPPRGSPYRRGLDIMPGTRADAIGRPLGPATMFTGLAISIFCPAAVGRTRLRAHRVPGRQGHPPGHPKAQRPNTIERRHKRLVVTNRTDIVICEPPSDRFHNDTVPWQLVRTTQDPSHTAARKYPRPSLSCASSVPHSPQPSRTGSHSVSPAPRHALCWRSPPPSCGGQTAGGTHRHIKNNRLGAV
jgi:hypothetical protein